jgi:hypothetical protein
MTGLKMCQTGPATWALRSNLHPSSVRLTKYQKGTYSSGIKIYSRLPTGIKQLSGDVNKFKLALKKMLQFATVAHAM